MQPYAWPLFVYPSRFCNFRCSYCFTDSSAQREARTFLVSHWERLAEEAAAAGVPELRLSGGEPLVLPQIEAMCATLVRHRLPYTLTTNGSTLAKHLPWLRRAPPTTLWISFHREYHMLRDFLSTVSLAVGELPCVGVNVFAEDWQDVFLTVGAQRIKVLAQTPVGRARSSESAVLAAVTAVPPTAVELRMEAPLRYRGPGTCVLRDRPLLSLDSDGRAYACCVTVGDPHALVGDFTSEPLATILGRSLKALSALPCATLLPRVASDEEGCPVALYPAD